MPITPSMIETGVRTEADYEALIALLMSGVARAWGEV
jgi:hypothetical protein